MARAHKDNDLDSGAECMRRTTTTELALCVLTAIASAASMPAMAQIAREDAVPTFGSHRLTTGFEPDPFTVDVIAGGELDVSQASTRCKGFVAKAPDVRIDYTAGNRYPLLIGAISATDTTIVVSAPDRTFHCDDDSWGDGDPIVRFERPASGIYLIWVGTYEAGSSPEATLVVSESTAIVDGN